MVSSSIPKFLDLKVKYKMEVLQKIHANEKKVEKWKIEYTKLKLKKINVVRRIQVSYIFINKTQF